MYSMTYPMRSIFIKSHTVWRRNFHPFLFQMTAVLLLFEDLVRHKIGCPLPTPLETYCYLNISNPCNTELRKEQPCPLHQIPARVSSGYNLSMIQILHEKVDRDSMWSGALLKATLWCVKLMQGIYSMCTPYFIYWNWVTSLSWSSINRKEC